MSRTPDEIALEGRDLDLEAIDLRTRGRETSPCGADVDRSQIEGLRLRGGGDSDVNGA